MSWEIRQGGALARLREMPSESVHCVVTSPPYFGLRDYGTAVWDGGDPGCDHVAGEIRTGLGLAAWSAENARGGGHKAADVDRIQFRGVCGKCGARRVDEQIGLEASPDEYVAALVAVFREVRRVLRSDGTLWLNLGDSYCAAASGAHSDRDRAREGWDGAFKVPSLARREVSRQGGDRRVLPNLKPKDLIGIPWLAAFALRADGWWLRSEIVWAKPNPMPESVTDRPTSAHEKLFLLAKSARYFYDADAIREEPTANPGGAAFYATRGLPMPARSDARKDHSGRRDGPETSGFGARVQDYSAGRNKRNVWEIATQPYADAHFATFPPALVEPCVLAGSSPRVCGVCGAPWERVSDRIASGWDGSRYGERAVEANGGVLSGGTKRSTLGSSGGSLTAEYRTVGWEAICGHADDSGRAVVLDPFAGSGTVGVVCEWHGRDFVGVELSEEYAEMARRRIAAEGPLGRRARRPREAVSGQLGFDLCGDDEVRS